MGTRDGTDIEAVLLGTAQDGGVPQAGCYCANCTAARAVPERRRLVACLGIVDRPSGTSWMIDATPDLPEQLHILQEFAPECKLSGILLTHAHIGHYTGLVHLGREAMDAKLLPVHATERMAAFIKGNEPWSSLVERSNIVIRTLVPDEPVELGPGLRITPVKVPHRDELSDTVAFVIEGPEKRVFYCPDIDSWDDWDRDVREFVSGMDIALLDGTFSGPDDLEGREVRDVPHPLVADTVERIEGVECDVHLIHLNHTNRLLGAGSAADLICSSGIMVGADGDRFPL